MTTQPAGEHHTGTLSPLTFDEIVATAAAATLGARIGDIRIALEAAYPAIRQHIAEQIAAAIEDYQHALEEAFEKRGHEADSIRADAAENCATITREIGGGQ